MEEERLKYAKKHWSKDNLRLQQIDKINYSGDKFFHLVIMYGTNRTVAFNCYNPEVVELISNTKNNEKLKVWFTIESREHNGKWYTNVVLKWAEKAQIKTPYFPKKESNTELFSDIHPNNDFLNDGEQR